MLAHEKSAVTPDCDKINVLESRLNNYWDEEMGREIEHYSLFEHVNMEKMTPHFLKLAKCTKPDYKLSDIKKEDGSDFGSDFGTDKERQEFIVS